MLTSKEQDVIGTGYRHPEQIAQYRIVRVLGEGGMGTVYEAVDGGAVRRNVALKVVRGGFQSREIRARFEAERQALALMDHPNIAKIFQAGETEAGDLFFAMELVKGLTLMDFCDSRRLSTKERLELFVSMCHAVQHAHQKGVIHRDLKPSNILVTEQDGKPCPKIIDFGIAKALGLQLTENTLVTQAGHPLGTVAFMSPEQAESSGIDVDTRTDIYSLGVILYMLLVGSLPVDPSGLPAHAFMFRLAQGDTQSPRPSARFTALGDYRVGIAQARRTDPEHLQRDLKGDLDWIVMKALDPDRSRRYDTAIGFAADVERFLSHVPVIARPPTPMYRITKFVRRHRGVVAATTVTVLALITSAILATAGLLRATRAERIAATEAASAKQVTDFLVDLFRLTGPNAGRGNSITARELLEKGAEKSATDLARQPEVQSRMMHTIGTAFSALGIYDKARSQLERALEIRTRVLGQDDPAVAETELALGTATMKHGDPATAEQHFTRALLIREKLFKGDDPRVARAVSGLASLRLNQGRAAEAEGLFKRVLAIDEKSLSANDTVIAGDLANLGIVYYSQQRYPEAEQMLRRSLAIQESQLGPDHPTLASVMNNLGGVYSKQGRYSDALPLYERTRAIFERTLDPTHPNIAVILNNVAEVYWKVKRYSDAEPLFRRALAIKEARFTPTNPNVASTLNGLAGLLRDQKRFAESEALYKRALTIRLKAFGSPNADVNETVKDYGELLRATGRSVEADALMKQYVR
ncbi:MAG TPA: serine/threonine-protein kinase [Gemmatimonadaceae bacterium]|nr:serine/threonine-protein kinase [Gemmatimonadaceae bacterium]